MRQKHSLRLLCGAAFVAFSVLGAPLASFAEDTKTAAEQEEPFDVSDVGSFSGAFLAARTADVDGDLDTAVKLYRIALDFQPDNIDVKQRLMITQLMNGQFDEGAELAEELKDDQSVERITTIVRAIDAIRDGKYKSAKSILNYKGPNDLDRLMNGLLQAWADAGAGREKQALALIESMEGPEWFSLFKNYNAGAIAIVSKDPDRARSYLNSAVTDRDGGSAAPDTFMRAVVALARLEATAGNRQKALDTISVGENFFNNYSPLKALRESIEKGEKQEQQVANATQGAASVLFSIGGALNREGAEDIVSLYLQSARALDPESDDTLVMLGGLAENRKQPEKAIELYRSVPESSPMRRVSELQLGLSLAAVGKTDEAKEHLKALIEADPKDVRSYLAYGSVLSDTKEYKEMGDIYDRAVEDAIGPVPNKSHWTVFFQRGIAYERQKKWEKAEPSFRKALELNPEQPQVLNYLGYSWIDMNMNLDEGMEMIRRAVELRPDDGYIVDSLGWAHFRLGDFEDAVRELEKAAELRAGDPTINDHLGDAYWRVGRKIEARYQWNRALGLKPEEAEIPKIQAKIITGLPELKEKDPASADAKDIKPAASPTPQDAAPDKKS